MAGEKKYSYIRYPYSKNGWYSFALSVISLVITVLVLGLSIARGGETTLFLASCGLTALVMGLLGLWFSFLALGEREKNNLFAFIGGGLGLILSVAWVVIIISGNG